MFNWLFGSNESESDVINNIFHHTLKGNNAQLTRLLTDYKIDPNICKDEYNNTPLHILANSNNVALAETFLFYGLKKDHVNVFGEKAVDIALKNNKLEMVKVLSDIVQDTKLVKRIEGLEAQAKTLYTRIQVSENNLTKANEEIKTLKRKRCDQCDVNVRECKRLKTDNDALTKTNEKLTKDNGDLQVTITNLRTSFKK